MIAGLATQLEWAAPSRWYAKYIAESFWLLHMTPILFPANATSDEMSSVERFDAPVLGST